MPPSMLIPTIQELVVSGTSERWYRTLVCLDDGDIKPVTVSTAILEALNQEYHDLCNSMQISREDNSMLITFLHELGVVIGQGTGELRTLVPSPSSTETLVVSRPLSRVNKTFTRNMTRAEKKSSSSSGLELARHITDGDLLPLLRGGFSSLDLDSTTISSIHTQVACLDIEVQSCQNEIASIQSSLQRIQEKYDHTVTDLSHKKSLLSPIRRVLPDVLLHIFNLAAEDSEICISSPPFILRSVCYTWRVLVLSSPSLWSKVNINLTKYLGETSESYNSKNRLLLRTAFSLSRNCPLRMSIRVVGTSPEAWALMINYIAPTSQRWKSLSLRVYDSASIFGLSNISGRLPMLESLDLNLYNSHPRNYFHAALSRIFRSVPLLRSVKIAGNIFAELSLPLHQLTTIDFKPERCRTSEKSLFYGCIAQGTELESFTFQRAYEGPSDMGKFSGPLPEITHPNIRQLSLGYDIPPDLKYCAFPALEDLTLFACHKKLHSGLIHTVHELGMISELLKRSKPRLRFFAVYRPLALPVFNDIAMGTFTSLTDLVIAVNEETSTEIVQILAEPSFVPCLQRLSLHICFTARSLFEDDSLYGMAISRHKCGLKSLVLSVPDTEALRTYHFPDNSDWKRRLLQIYKLKEAGLGVIFSLNKADFFDEEDASNELANWLNVWTILDRFA
ncbi:uncharacterized protein BT62DRAFT_924767 [Guyanagaster necrorhizus]|uniref:F-box domain-containing protein n=1 Tax=Guyanagaster necrorhizus TaxID=856835 RepID=A0A9P8AL85_9AGAR|nr:uncharacterized protein BT62DRAFT_924767 [Guyanagaster necrorhizus MCA 3950]KAG7439371.1 hypothetical protein BT62DRAFT_924767 [Guyanagaster necrorhizus MCA 3950]